MKNHIYYHNDLDGKASAAIVIKHIRDRACSLGLPDSNIICYEMDYNKSFDDYLINPGDKVYIVDFSFPDYVMKEILTRHEVCWIDHHDTCLDFANKFKDSFTGIVESGKAACLLTWEYFFKDDPPSKWLLMLAQYDIWDKEGKYDWDDCKALQLGLHTTNTHPEQCIWRDILSFHSIDFMHEIINTGNTIQDFNTKRQKSLMLRSGYSGLFAGYKSLIINTAEKGSHIFESAYDVQEYDLMVSYNYDGKSWRVSMYSVQDHIHCGEICHLFGGGGHKGAAGFVAETSLMLKLLEGE